MFAGGISSSVSARKACGAGINLQIQECAEIQHAKDRGVVLIVSEKQLDAHQVSEMLDNLGFRTQWVKNVAVLRENSLEYSAAIEPVVGTVLCHRRMSAVRQVATLPELLPGKRVIVLSDCDAEQTAVSLLENGAHHFFSINDSATVLQVRLDAALRWHHAEQQPCVSFGDIRFDIQRRQVSRGGVVVDLSPKEYELAYYLFSNKDRVVGNSELMTSIWSLPPSMDTRRIDTAACRLRKKLRLKSNSGWELKRLRSIGYKLLEGHAVEDKSAQSSLLSIVPA